MKKFIVRGGNGALINDSEKGVMTGHWPHFNFS